MRTFSLDKARADGWLEQLGEGSQGFAQLCEVIGRHFVAFSVIAGIRITALTVDPRDPEGSVVEFEIGEIGGAQRLDLGDFRQRLAGAMLSADEDAGQLPEDPDADQIQSFIGFRYVLLAPLFDIELRVLRVDDDGIACVEAVVEGHDVDLSLAQLRDLVRERVRVEAERHKPPSPFAIDLNVVPKARAAAAANDSELISELLGGWPGPLSLLLRTAEGQGLAPDVRATLAEALGILGSAYADLGRYDWAQEVLRLGIQWAQDRLDVAADLFLRLGQAHVAEGRHGEAIGLLRRSLALGGPRLELLPLLARSFLERGRHVAALLCADEALAAGAATEAVSDIRKAALEVLGDTWERLRLRVPA